ncbi:MAG: ATP-binding protein [Aeromicrobium erythreum]
MTDPDAFIETFAAFLHEVVESHRGQRSDEPGAATLAVSEHLGTDAREVPVVTETVSRARLVDAEIALAALDPGHRVIGIGGARHHGELSFSELLRGTHGALEIGPVAYTSMAAGPARTQHVVTLGVRLLSFEGRPVAVLQRDAQQEWGRSQPTIEVITEDQELARSFVTGLRDEMRRLSVLRGQVISFDHDDFHDSLGGLTFHERPEVARDEIVLPAETLDRLEHHVVEMGRHRDVLLAAGQHLKRGILLYGPPGTGKTHTVRYLLSHTHGVTAILLSGNRLGLVREAVKIARVMEPAIVVLEDCDLVAEDRDMIDSPDSMLFELMEALDGLEGDADVTFVMTTNRADLLEKALTQRPGRVDLALEVPLPDRAGREALFALYARDRGLSADAIARAAARAEGVTASFAKELVRRTVLRAAVEGHPVGDGDLDASLDELLSDREQFTRSLLASGPTVFAATDDDDDDEWFDD